MKESRRTLEDWAIIGIIALTIALAIYSMLPPAIAKEDALAIGREKAAEILETPEVVFVEKMSSYGWIIEFRQDNKYVITEVFNDGRVLSFRFELKEARA